MAEGMQSAILEKEKKRYRFLLSLYELVEENNGDWISRPDIIKRSGLDPRDAREAEDYLQGEGLLDVKTMGPDGSIELTHQGMVEVEQSIKNPDRSTSHFQYPAIHQVTQHFHSAVGAVQTGNQNIANVNQTVGANTSEIIDLLRQARESFHQLPPTERQEATELADLIEGEVVSESPSPTKLKSYGRSLLPLAEKVTTALVIEGIKLFLGL